MKNRQQKYSDFMINKVNKDNKNYPKSLLVLKRPPSKLYYRGELKEKLFAKSIAIVGSRRMTRYGASVVDRFVSYFATHGITTISGYMYGVDTEVHSKTVEYGGRTVAVMGGGIDSPYPPENDKLYTKILQSGGLVLSEYEPESTPKLWMYPQRNRIIAALATIGILVVEASEKSGSLITVKFAEQLNKKIFAVPGHITSSVSTGTNYIIKKGIAELVTSPEDIVKTKSSKEKSDIDDSELSDSEREIIDVLKREEMTVDEIAFSTSIDFLEISSLLTTLSLKGVVMEAQGKYYLKSV